MAHYHNVGGVVREVKKRYHDMDGVAREVTKAYHGVDGVAREYFSSATPVPVGDLAVGSSVFLNIDGASTEFLIVHQGRPSYDYDISCDGIWLLQKNVIGTYVWGSTDSSYAFSDIHSYLNDTFINKIVDDGIRNAIKQVKIPYTENDGTLHKGSDGASAKIFLLSIAETGVNNATSVNTEGAILDYFNGGGNSKRIAYAADGTARSWWTRTVKRNSIDVYSVYTTGSAAYGSCTGRDGLRPALILPPETLVDSNVDEK